MNPLLESGPPIISPRPPRGSDCERRGNPGDPIDRSQREAAWGGDQAAHPAGHPAVDRHAHPGAAGRRARTPSGCRGYARDGPNHTAAWRVANGQPATRALCDIRPPTRAHADPAASTGRLSWNQVRVARRRRCSWMRSIEPPPCASLAPASLQPSAWASARIWPVTHLEVSRACPHPIPIGTDDQSSQLRGRPVYGLPVVTSPKSSTTGERPARFLRSALSPTIPCSPRPQSSDAIITTATEWCGCGSRLLRALRPADPAQ